jgi:hypothetical protein
MTKIYTQPVTERGNKGKVIAGTYLDPDVLRRFKVQCAIEGRSMTRVNEELILEYLKKKEKERG